MGVLRVNADVEAGGPIFDGRADAALSAWAHDTARELGDLGVRELRSFTMNKSGRAHGGFQANLHVYSEGPEARVPGPMIRGVTWSPWLEGTSKRNSSTGFGGYRLFRKTAARLRRRAAETGQRVMRRYIGQMGGE